MRTDDGSTETFVPDKTLHHASLKIQRHRDAHSAAGGISIGGEKDVGNPTSNPLLRIGFGWPQFDAER